MSVHYLLSGPESMPFETGGSLIRYRLITLGPANTTTMTVTSRRWIGD
jgi:hypothetical protein